MQYYELTLDLQCKSVQGCW